MALVERYVLSLVFLHQVVVHVPEGFGFGVDGLFFQFVQVCVNGCLQYLLGRLRLISRQTLDLFHQSWFSQFDSHDSPPPVCWSHPCGPCCLF